MLSLSQLPSDITRKDFVKALEKCGFVISTKGGKGSHIKAVWPPTGKCLIVQDSFRKDVLYEIVKEVERYTPVTWEKLRDHL